MFLFNCLTPNTLVWDQKTKKKQRLTWHTFCKVSVFPQIPHWAIKHQSIIIQWLSILVRSLLTPIPYMSECISPMCPCSLIPLSFLCLIVIQCLPFEEPRQLVCYWFYLQGFYILLCANQGNCFQVHAWINASLESAPATACGSIPPIYVLITMIY